MFCWSPRFIHTKLVMQCETSLPLLPSQRGDVAAVVLGDLFFSQQSPCATGSTPRTLLSLWERNDHKSALPKDILAKATSKCIFTIAARSTCWKNNALLLMFPLTIPQIKHLNGGNKLNETEPNKGGDGITTGI